MLIECRLIRLSQYCKRHTYSKYFLNAAFEVPKFENSCIANSMGPDKVAHDEPPHLDLHCLPSNL